MKMTNIICLLLVAFISNVTAASQDEKLAQLQEVIIESKLLPTPVGVGGKGARFGESVAIDGNRALIGSPTALEHGVAYIFDYDGTTWNEAQLIFPDDINAENRFGISVSIDGDRAIIGDKFNRVNGAHQAGAVYVYELNNGLWQLSQKLIASDAGSVDKFGSSVSLSGDRILIGATDYDDATNGNGSGAAYIFDYDGTSWQESAILTATGGSSGDGFGNAVSLEGDNALVGVKNYDDNNNGINTGSAYLFTLAGVSWSQTKQFLASDGADNDSFGVSVGISANSVLNVLIGAPGTDEIGSSAGSAYIYEFDGLMWTETKLLAPDARNADKFGGTVSIESNRMLVGATDGGILPARTGSAYIFDYDTNTSLWVFTQEIAADDITTSNHFSSSIGLSGDKVIVGNFNDRDNGSQSGAAYAFELIGGTWQQNQKIMTQGATDDQFGYAISLDGNRALIGAPFDTVDSIGRGAAYIFDYVGGQWSTPIKLFASDESLNFGSAVDLDSDNAIIAANRINTLSSGTAYIFNFDGSNWNQVALIESPVITSDEFASSVSILTGRAIIGASQDSEAGIKSGTAYVYEQIAGTWQQADKLIPSDGQLFDAFGVSVSLSNDRVLVGAYTKDEDISNLSRAGAAYIYDYDAVNDLWIETKLLATVPSSSGFFGIDVDLGQDRAVIGATGNSQTAYIFDYDSMLDTWSGIELVTSANSSSQFGYSVSLENNRVLVGAPQTSINGEQFIGAAYQFDFDGGLWNETKTYTAIDGARRDFYGWDVALSANDVMISAYKDNDGGTDSGSVYSYLDDVIFANGFE